MSGRIGRYTYKNESVLKEFLGTLAKILAKRGASKIQKQLKKDPEMKKLMQRMEKDAIALKKRQEKERKTDPEMDNLLKSFGL